LREGTSNGSLTLTEAVRKMTSMPAARYGLTGRGLLQPGAVADIVAFDPGTITDRSTFADPWQVSHGIRHVWLRGNPALTDGAVTTSRYGQVLTDL
jgi:N-acyl-D-amino-acid deacylase